MRLSDPGPQAALSAWRRDPDPAERACADNVWFEERVGPARLGVFEKYLGGAATPDDLRDSQAKYWNETVKAERGGDVPHTFDAALQPADLGSATLDDGQRIVRVENLLDALRAWPHPFDSLSDAHKAGDAAVLDGFLDSWDRARDGRPAFATWRDCVLEEIEADDWAERLRDRMGLAHYDVARGPLPVALMEYTVREVKAEAGSVAAMFTAPTALDSGPWPQFFPAPKDAPYGRAMALTPVYDDSRLLAELLHTRLTYRRHHIIRLGLLIRPYRKHDMKLLRNAHLSALRVATVRDDFGEEID